MFYICVSLDCPGSSIRSCDESQPPHAAKRARISKQRIGSGSQSGTDAVLCMCDDRSRRTVSGTSMDQWGRTGNESTEGSDDDRLKKLQADTLTELHFETVDPVAAAAELIEGGPKHSLLTAFSGWQRVSVSQFCALLIGSFSFPLPPARMLPAACCPDDFLLTDGCVPVPVPVIGVQTNRPSQIWI